MLKLVLLTLISVSVYATDKPKHVYMTPKGDTMTSQEALVKALSGDTVLKCQQVEASVSKSGSSISLRGKK